MKQLLKHFWSAFLVLGAIAAVFWGADQVEQLWLAWVIVGGASAYALLRVLWPQGVDVLLRVRGYPGIAADLAKRTDELAAAKTKVATVTGQRLAIYTAGLREGHDRWSGWFGSIRSPEMSLIAVSSGDSGLQLSASFEEEEGDAPRRVREGARFALIVEATGEQKGIVEAVSVDQGLVTLVCVRPTVKAFWEKLETRAIEDPSPPKGLVLKGAGMTSYGEPELDTESALEALDDHPEEEQ